MASLIFIALQVSVVSSSALASFRASVAAATHAASPASGNPSAAAVPHASTIIAATAVHREYGARRPLSPIADSGGGRRIEPGR
ncbi:MAG: hypothetical protein AAFX58_07425 [Pseudomonadota bacterium]